MTANDTARGNGPAATGTGTGSMTPATMTAMTEPTRTMTATPTADRPGAGAPLGTSRSFEDAYAELASNEPVLELRNVTYKYPGTERLILDGFTHGFTRNRLHAIIGPSGSGKTTLLSLLSGLTLPTTGDMLYNGRNLRNMNRYDYRSQRIGVVFQSFNLLPALTVAENIRLSIDASCEPGTRREKNERIEQLLDTVKLPREYAGERILHLSGGEQQRVAIARALSYEPEVILADEPTGNLDPATQNDIIGILSDIAHKKHRTVIIVTHNPEVAAAADTILTIKRNS